MFGDIKIIEKIVENIHRYPGLKSLSLKSRIILFWTSTLPFINETASVWALFSFTKRSACLVRRIYLMEDYIGSALNNPHTVGCDQMINIDLANLIVNSFPKQNKFNLNYSKPVIDGIERRVLIAKENIDYRWVEGTQESQSYDQWFEQSTLAINTLMPPRLNNFDEGLWKNYYFV